MRLKEGPMTTIKYTKQFQTGRLKGLEVEQRITFPVTESSYHTERFTTGTTGQDFSTKAEWIITASEAVV